MKREMLCLDFDGVLHAYTSPWEAADKVPDGSVPGAIRWLLEAMREYDIAILSARSGQVGGIQAMQFWLKRELVLWLKDSKSIKDTLERYEVAQFTSESNDDNYEYLLWADKVVNTIQWPVTKLPCKLYIDDNAHRFDGTFPSLKEIKDLESWVKR